MIGPVHLSAAANREWKLQYTFDFARFYIETLDNVSGGSLHIVLSDGNLEDGHINACRSDARKIGDHVGVALTKCLLELTATERQQLYSNLRRISDRSSTHT